MKYTKWLDKNIPSLEGKLYIVTGANSGIGFHTTLSLVYKGASVIMACRNLTKAQKAKEKILEEFPNANLFIEEYDQASFDSISVLSLVEGRDHLVKFLLSGLSNLFADALIISLPIMGSLLLITVCTGLLSKAAPQMNLLSEGFPVMILVAFFIIMTILPNLCDFFIQSFASGFKEMENLFIQISGGV